MVVGGDAAGMSAASQARRRRDDLEIIALEKGRWTSYSACGIPYVVGGVVPSLDPLVVRTPEEFATTWHIDARTGHEVRAIDLDRRTVEVHEHDGSGAGGRTYDLGFDILHIATGAAPLRPDLPGIDDEHIHGVQTLEDADHLLGHLADDDGVERRRAVVVGGGYIGLEMAEAFLRRGWHVTVVDQAPHVMPSLDPDIAEVVADAMRSHGIDVRCDTPVHGFEPGVVHTADGPLHHDLVVLGMGVGPNSGLARDAGLATGVKDAISVDRRQRTSADGVWAAGDCCESFHRVAEAPMHIALGTVANKQGRVAGINIGGGYATFPGVVGTAATKLCDVEVARTGLNESEARQYGFEAVSATIESTSHAGYFPDPGWVKLKLIVERRSGRVLGGQLVGVGNVAKRVDVLATAITAELTVEEMTGLDLSYAPPFSPVWDPVLLAARKAAEALEAPLHT